VPDKQEAAEEQRGINFHEVLLDVYGKPLTQAKPTQKQEQEMRDAQATANNRASSPSEMRDALATLREIENAVPEPEVRLGEVCINSLNGETEAKEQDGQQLQNRFRYALKIRGTYNSEDNTGEFATVSFSDARISLMCRLIKGTYQKSATVYARSYALLHGRDQDDMGPDDD